MTGTPGWDRKGGVGPRCFDPAARRRIAEEACFARLRQDESAQADRDTRGYGSLPPSFVRAVSIFVGLIVGALLWNEVPGVWAIIIGFGAAGVAKMALNQFVLILGVTVMAVAASWYLALQA